MGKHRDSTATPTKSFQSPSSFPNSCRGGGMGGTASIARPLLTCPPEPRRALHPNEHLLNVRVPRARKPAARLAFTATPIKSFQSSSSPSPNSWRDGRGRPHVRASDEHLPSVRVPRAQRSPLRPTPSLLPPRHVISLLNQTPHHRIGVRRIRFKRSVGTTN